MEKDKKLSDRLRESFSGIEICRPFSLSGVKLDGKGSRRQRVVGTTESGRKKIFITADGKGEEDIIDECRKLNKSSLIEAITLMGKPSGKFKAIAAFVIARPRTVKPQ